MLSERESESLLSKLCSALGFCLSPDARRQLLESPPATADDFADAVFLAEGLDPSTADRHLYRQVRAMTSEAFQSGDEKREYGV
jgi:hypothetical protein